MTGEAIEKQIRDATRLFADGITRGLPKTCQGPKVRRAIEAAVMSGIVSTAQYLQANDGSETITPAAVERAVVKVGKGMGLILGSIDRLG